MSRVAKAPVSVPGGVDIKINGQSVSAKGAKGTLELNLNSLVEVVQEENLLKVAPKENSST
jgi:large subunit ribosomal protein L6